MYLMIRLISLARILLIYHAYFVVIYILAKLRLGINIRCIWIENLAKILRLRPVIQLVFFPDVHTKFALRMRKTLEELILVAFC